MPVHSKPFLCETPLRNDGVGGAAKRAYFKFVRDVSIEQDASTTWLDEIIAHCGSKMFKSTRRSDKAYLHGHKLQLVEEGQDEEEFEQKYKQVMKIRGLNWYEIVLGVLGGDVKKEIKKKKKNKLLI